MKKCPRSTLRERTRASGIQMLGIALGGIFLLAAIVPGVAFAAEGPGVLWKACTTGSGAGQCKTPIGIASSPTNGDLYVADLENSRVNEFTAWGQFVRAWGWGVKDGGAELQVCTTQTGCRKALQGSGTGEFITVGGVAVDALGNVYVTDPINHRVQKFDSEGHFLLMFGGGVDKGPNHPGDICTAAFIAEGESCGAGTIGAGNAQFAANWLAPGSNIAIGTAGQVFVGDENRIQVFDSGGVYQSQLPIPHPGLVNELAVDPVSGNLYMAYRNEREALEPIVPNVYRLDSSNGAVLNTLEVEKPSALAADASGSVYVFDNLRFLGGQNPATHSARILKFDASGNLVERIAEAPFAKVNSPGAEEIETSSGLATGSNCFREGEGGLYVTAQTGAFHDPTHEFVQAYFPTPDPAKCPPPPVAPSVTAEYALSVDAKDATLGAGINPHFWTDATYRVRYGTAQCIEEGGWEASCVSEQPTAPGSKLGPKVTNQPVSTAGVVLVGLEPNTAYRYRFVSESSGGGPATGAGKEFHTPPLAGTPNTSCPNQAFRTSASAGLPDCRAYELVSPLDKAGGDVQARNNAVPYPARMDQSSLSGNGLAYSSYRAFAGAQSGPFSSQYLAHRNPGSGWSTEAISPPQEGPAFLSALIPVDNAFRAFSPELTTSWLLTDTEPLLGPGGIPGHPNLYRRDSGAGTYGGCTNAVPQLEPESDHAPQLQGTSADQSLAVFRTENKLTEDASTQRKSGNRGIYQLYACSFSSGEGAEAAQLHLVSVLPNGTASNLENTAGGPANQGFQSDQGRTATLENAVSIDGSKVYWTASEGNDASLPGALYLRLNPAAEPTASGKCMEEEPEGACTLLVASGKARFWTAAKDGSVAIFGKEEGKSAEESLFEYDLESQSAQPIAHKALGVLGASDNATKVYFLSEEDLGGAAIAGQPNLYLHEAGGANIFLATLSGTDGIAGNQDAYPSPANPEPVWHSSRVNPDGQTVAFMSTSPELAEEVAGYDNTDQGSGEPAAEIYRYAAGEGLACVSCNRTGARPRSGQVQSIFFNFPFYAAALLPPWENSLYAPRVLSEDGKRVFFESFEALVSQDTNGKVDVYQWEQAASGDCDEGDSSYVEASDGCVSLISSGKSSTDSQFVDASPDGHDVFIRTAASLVGWDPGQTDIYDARVQGGFPEPQGLPSGCEGEACQGPASPPEDATPSSSSFEGAGNVSEPVAKKKAKRHKKKHAKKHTKTNQKQAKRNRGQRQ